MQRAVVVVRVTVTARVPCRGLEVPAECGELPVPIVPVAADAMQKKNKRAVALHRERKARRRFDDDDLRAYSNFAPEIFTARSRLSLSDLRKAANSSGELPTTS